MTAPSNTNGNPNEASDKAFFCPSCGSANVNASALAGGAASCGVCSWKGAVEELAVHHFQHGMGSPEQILHHFFLDVRKILSGQFAGEMLTLLVKWGFLNPSKVDPKVATRYIGAMAKGMAAALFAERGKIDKEKFDEQQNG